MCDLLLGLLLLCCISGGKLAGAEDICIGGVIGRWAMGPSTFICPIFRRGIWSDEGGLTSDTLLFADDFTLDPDSIFGLASPPQYPSQEPV